MEISSDLENTEGINSTLLDEAIAYGIQSIYSKIVDPVGSLEPRVLDSDDEFTRKQKILGQKLKPKLEECLKQDKKIDKEFFVFACNKIKEVESEFRS